jgi:hypothetical protein
VSKVAIWGFAVLLSVVGCATGPIDVETAKRSWDGAKYEDVVLAWGAPARSTELAGGREAHTWLSESTVSRPSVYPSIGIFGGSGRSGVGAGAGVTLGGGGAHLVRCERTLVFQDGRVVEQSWSGPAQACRGFERA